MDKLDIANNENEKQQQLTLILASVIVKKIEKITRLQTNLVPAGSFIIRKRL